MFFHLFYKFLSQIVFAIIIFPTWLVVGLFKPDLLVGLKEKLGFDGKGTGNRKQETDFYSVPSSPFPVPSEHLLKGENND